MYALREPKNNLPKSSKRVHTEILKVKKTGKTNALYKKGFSDDRKRNIASASLAVHVA